MSTIILFTKRHICPLKTPRRENKRVYRAQENRNNLGMIMPYSTDWKQIPTCFPQGEMQSECWELGFLCIWESSAVFAFEGLGGVSNSAMHIKLYTLGGNAGIKPISSHKLGKCSTSSCSPSFLEERSALEYTCTQGSYRHLHCILSSKKCSQIFTDHCPYKNRVLISQI